MKRRAFLTTFVPACLSAALGLSLLGGTIAAAQDRMALQAAFEDLPMTGRTVVQSELQTVGLYQGGLDGRYGPGTEAALINGAAFLAENSRGKIMVDLSGAAGVSTYVRGLAAREYSAWLYGEGEECDSDSC